MTLAERFEDLFREVLGLRDSASEQTTAGLGAIYASRPYEDLVALGPEVLPLLMERIARGEIVLNEAVCRIASLKPSELTGKAHPTEQELAQALGQWWEGSQVHVLWTAAAGAPDPRPLHPIARPTIPESVRWNRDPRLAY